MSDMEKRLAAVEAKVDSGTPPPAEECTLKDVVKVLETIQQELSRMRP